jgi:hypothetical protein
MNNEKRTHIAHVTAFNAGIERREDGEENLYIEGYFAVFNDTYELWPGATESIAPGAFSGALAQDIRALINHDTSQVLGRTKAGTLELKEDSRGLWGRIHINRDDVDAMNLYARVKRGDVDQCSFGFEIAEEKEDFRQDGTVHWTILRVDPLYEVSPCTFPAYENTSIAARHRDYDEIMRRKNEAWRVSMKNRLKGVNS